MLAYQCTSRSYQNKRLYRTSTQTRGEPVDENTVMTLRDIVVIINKQELKDGKVDNRGVPKTRHADAMNKIEKLSKEPSFGATRKIRVVYNDQGQTMETYAFTKKQSVAAGARINNAKNIHMVAFHSAFIQVTASNYWVLESQMTINFQNSYIEYLDVENKAYIKCIRGNSQRKI